MEENKGYGAQRPKEIPKAGWKDIFKRVKEDLDKDYMHIVAAGVAFYFFMAIFPAIVAIITIYGLVTDPGQVQDQLSALAGVLPEEAYEVISERLEDVAGQSGGALGWGAALSIGFALWSANKGTISLFDGVNIAYNERNERNMIRKVGICMLFTLGGMILGLLAVAVVMAFPALVDNLGLPDTIETVIKWARWPLLGAIIMFAIAMVYQYAPDRKRPRFKWVSWGAVIATVLWIGGSLLFSWYVSNFGEFDEMYGSLAAVIILLIWFNLTSFVILLGAEINSELEHQTRKDTTVGESQPMGERDAYHADHTPKSRKDRESQSRESRDRERKTRDRERKH